MAEVMHTTYIKINKAQSSLSTITSSVEAYVHSK
jgi:hypothetical protein